MIGTRSHDTLEPRLKFFQYTGNILVLQCAEDEDHRDLREILIQRFAQTIRRIPVVSRIDDNRWLASLAARLARFERPEAPAAFRTLERDELPELPLTLLPADAAIRQRFILFGLTHMRQLAELPRSVVARSAEEAEAAWTGQDGRGRRA